MRRAGPTSNPSRRRWAAIRLSGALRAPRRRVSPRRLTLRRDHLLLGEAQNGGAIALAGRPGSLEAIDRCAGQPKIVGALRAPVRLHEAAGRRGRERLVSGGGDFNADHSDTVFHRSRCRLVRFSLFRAYAASPADRAKAMTSP